MKLALLVGENPRPFDIVASLAVGAILAVFVIWQAPQMGWKAILLATLAFDIGAGLVSNATAATRKAWQTMGTPARRRGFVLTHLTLYPAALFWLADGAFPVFAILTGMLVAKTWLFWSGQRETEEEN